MNLSALTIDNNTTQLLDKGLTFIPTFRVMQRTPIISDLNYISRRIKLYDYYLDKEESNNKSTFEKLFINKSSWTPSWQSISTQTKHTLIQIKTQLEKTLNPITIIRNDKKLIKHFIYKDNLTKGEKTALRLLKQEKSIIIKQADKGGAVVIMDKQLYLKEAHRQLNDNKYYLQLPTLIQTETATIINSILEKCRQNNFISDKQFTYLSPMNRSFTPRYFYLLPKVHKPRRTWPHHRMPAGRPIVSDTNSESNRICEYIDYFLQPLANKHLSYIKDTYHFVEKIRNQEIPNNSFIVTADVTSLYTNMNLDRIISTIKQEFNNNPNPKRPDDLILELLETTLRRNDFEFNGKFFLQTCGIAMGRRYAPSAANIYMKSFDSDAMTYHIKPLLYSRFLDDIFFIWTESLEKLHDFETYLNGLIPGIQITLKANSQINEFLDTYVYKAVENNKTYLRTKVFFKSTDTHQLLHRHSFHPKHTFQGIIRSQHIRFKRISSSFEDYKEASDILHKVLKTRGYSASFLRKIRREIWRSYDCAKTTMTDEKKSENIIPIITLYDNINSNLNRLWKTTIANNDLFDGVRLISAYKRHKNLRDHLIRGRLSSHNSPDDGPLDELIAALDKMPSTVTPSGLNNGTTRCTRTTCKTCSLMPETKQFLSYTTGQLFTIHQPLNCQSTNIIYLITCNLCKKQYVGETGRSLANRTTDHISCIKTYKSTPIGLHFNLPNHAWRNLSILPIEQLDDTRITHRRMRETHWQKTLKTAYPFGLNNL